MDQTAAQTLIEHDRRNADVLFPYVNGEDLNTRPDSSGSRWIINFFDWSEERAQQYPDCFEIIEKFVKPERQRVNVSGPASYGDRFPSATGNTRTNVPRSIRPLRGCPTSSRSRGAAKSLCRCGCRQARS